MGTLTLTRRFTFEMAHALLDYNGACRQIHGHSYKLFVTVQGNPSTEKGNSDYGMVIDFSALKSIVNQSIIESHDHCLVLRKGSIDDDTLDSMKESWSNIKVVDYQPTCENMVVNFANILAPLMPEGVKLRKVKLYETESSYATYKL